jgi:hypothetical protein
MSFVGSNILAGASGQGGLVATRSNVVLGLIVRIHLIYQKLFHRQLQLLQHLFG